MVSSLKAVYSDRRTFLVYPLVNLTRSLIFQRLKGNYDNISYLNSSQLAAGGCFNYNPSKWPKKERIFFGIAEVLSFSKACEEILRNAGEGIKGGYRMNRGIRSLRILFLGNLDNDCSAIQKHLMSPAFRHLMLL